MQPSAKVPVSRDAMIEFARLTKASEMVLWNKKYTPWVFDICPDAEKLLTESYQKQLDGTEKPEVFTKEVLEEMSEELKE